MNRPELPLLVALAALVGGAGAVAARSPAAGSTTAIEHVSVVGIGGSRPISDATVLVVGQRIAWVGPTARAHLPRSARRIDARGKFLIPGLWDMHVHIFNNGSHPGTDNHARYFPLFIANGVTGVRDMWTDADDVSRLRGWRRAIAVGTMIGPRIVAASPIFDGVPVDQPNSLGVTTPAVGRDGVRAAKAAGSEFIKVYDRLPRDAYFAIADEARRQRLPFAGHIPHSVRATEAASAGQASVEHLTGMLIACSSAEDRLFPKGEPDDRASIQLTVASFDEAKCRRVARAFASRGGWHDPTLVVLRARWRLASEDSVDPRLRFASKEERAEWAAIDAAFMRRDGALLGKVYHSFQGILVALDAEGVGLLAGTDVGNPHVFAGSSVQDELALMVEAGVSPERALAAATVNPARFLHREATLGSVTAGKFADLVLLEGDPLQNIGNVRRIAGVFSNGRYFDRPALDRMMDSAAHAAETE
ncbi:MAG: amidohydrolase family protein [Allosphingosinicella sp.]